MTLFRYSSIQFLTLTIIGFLMTTGCNRGPKIISSPVEIANNPSGSGIFSEETSPSSETTKSNDLHTVVVNEMLPTDKYVYLNVTEGEEQFWIATAKKDIEKGEVYFYRGGLLKTNFESKEYNRVFDKIYLVSNVVKANHGNAATTSGQLESKVAPTKSSGQIKVVGSIRIADLIDNPAKYEGTMIQLSGECVKLNSNIMGRNWIHLKDGSKDDYDLVITSKTPIAEGSVVTLRGTVSLDRDFGAGYRYDIIVEEAVIIN